MLVRRAPGGGAEGGGGGRLRDEDDQTRAGGHGRQSYRGTDCHGGFHCFGQAIRLCVVRVVTLVPTAGLDACGLSVKLVASFRASFNRHLVGPVLIGQTRCNFLRYCIHRRARDSGCRAGPTEGCTGIRAQLRCPDHFNRWLSRRQSWLPRYMRNPPTPITRCSVNGRQRPTRSVIITK